MFKSILKVFRGETSISKKCVCGQQADGKCVVIVDVSRNGVLSQKAADVIRCGAFQKQSEAASRIVAKNDKL